MRTYERNGVHVDQCAECRGIFLDRGELERLVDAETAWHGSPAAAAPTSHQQPAHQQTSHQPGHSQPYGQPHQQGSQAASLGAVVSEVLGQVRSSGHGTSHSGYGYGGKKKKSLISELFG